MQNNSFLKLLFFVCTVAFFASCDKDFNEIGADIIGDDHFGLIQDTTKTVIAYNQSIGAVESSNLTLNALGYYNNAFFGKTRASIVTQVVLDTLDQTIGTAPIVTKVELSLPYFSHLKEKNTTTGDSTYLLDSINGTAKIKLSVYESKYYLRDYDATSGFIDGQKYYSDATSEFDTNKNPTRLNDDTDASQNEQFFFNDAEIKTYKTVDGAQVVDTRSAPGMRLKLNSQFFQDKLFGTAAAGKLVNNDVFKRYFNGLYLKADNADNSPNQGSLASLNIKLGKIIVTYNVTVTSAAGVVTIKEKKLGISLGGNSVNLFENDYNTGYTTQVTSTTNATTGDYRLYPKGGAGSMAIIELFGADIKAVAANGTLYDVVGGNGVADELDLLRNPTGGQKLLVNEANLTFYVDRASMTELEEPNRIYLYDLNNHTPIIDYYMDSSVGSNTKLNKKIHGGILEKDVLSTIVTKRGIKYKIRLTNHVRNLISKDSTNVRLGLVVTESIATTSNAKLKNTTTGANPFSKIPTSSVINPLGTVLFGNNIPNDLANKANYAKRLKLEIYYTKPN